MLSTPSEQKPNSKIYVCQARTCRLAGSRATLLEIEELIQSCPSDSISAFPSGCLSNCDYPPNALLLSKGEEILMEQVKTYEDSKAVVDKAFSLQSLPAPIDNKNPDLKAYSENHDLTSAARVARALEQSRARWKWNCALLASNTLIDLTKMSRRSIPGSIISTESLLCERIILYENAGAYTEALQLFDELLETFPAIKAQQAWKLWKARLLSKLKRYQDAENSYRDLLQPSNISRLNHGRDYTETVVTELMKLQVSKQKEIDIQRRHIQGYERWTLEDWKPISSHTALYFLHKISFGVEKDPIGFNFEVESMNSIIAWHTTLLAHIGPNHEGPLDYIERDYTPISSKEEWNQGKCILLVKVYEKGQATRWLMDQSKGKQIFLSYPKPTWSISLIEQSTYRSILWVVGGTGIAPSLQFFQHSSFEKLPIVLLYSYRQQDESLTPCITDFSSLMKKFTQLRIHIFETNVLEATTWSPFQKLHKVSVSTDETHHFLQHYQHHFNQRISRRILEEELSQLALPCQVVISGNKSFNCEMQKKILDSNLVQPEWIQVFKA